MADDKITIQDLERELEVYKKETIELRKQFSGRQTQINNKEQQDKESKAVLQVCLLSNLNLFKAKNNEIDKYLNEISLLSKKNSELEENVKELLEDLDVLRQKSEE